MEKRITREEVDEFRNTENGRRKFFWLKIGVVIDLLFTLLVCLMHIYAYCFPNPYVYYIVLYFVLVIIVFGAELIGTYFGALEEYVIMKEKKIKKEVDFLDN